MLTEDGWLEHTLETPDRQSTDVWDVTGYAGHFVAVGSTTERDVRHIAEHGIVPTAGHRGRPVAVGGTLDRDGVRGARGLCSRRLTAPRGGRPRSAR